MNSTKNLWLLMRLLPSHPIEFFDRVEVIYQAEKEKLFLGNRARSAYPERLSFEDALRALSGVFRRPLLCFLGEPELEVVQSHTARLTRELETRATLPFPTVYNADSTIAQLAYLLCRVLEPETVVETGVAYGVTSATILAALHKNRKGTLHSVDLPPVGHRASHVHIGMMIPPEYRNRWHLHLGSSKRVLPSLLSKDLAKVDIFIHDSANTHKVQRMELKAVWSYMSSRSAIIVNGIHRNTAFAESVKENKVDCWFAIEQREKRDHLTGVILRALGPTQDGAGPEIRSRPSDGVVKSASNTLT